MDWNPPDVWDELQQHLEGIGDTLPARPSAIIVISAHWEESDIVITSGSAPGLIYDYYGFPQQTYELTYPAPGAPALAKRAAELLVADGHSFAVSRAFQGQ